jgi:hypothetical protein
LKKQRLSGGGGWDDDVCERPCQLGYVQEKRGRTIWERMIKNDTVE